ncbi:hypothetical protein SASPL_148783 [Salvia splendens]|uniref:Mitochondrial import inner membrane translocase subunit TIM23 n=1 Tax=Salvia splendens TaxID=180675 RepID=A0A8X8WBI6_SALSN|nr:hypothetical protein SASPL_148783 [Salvia splendens]
MGFRAVVWEEGRQIGNRCGVIWLMYAGLESGMVEWRDTDDVNNSVVAGLATGALYKVASGPRAAALAGALGGVVEDGDIDHFFVLNQSKYGNYKLRHISTLTTALIAIAAVALGWCTIEIACKPCLEKGREAIDRNLNPNYDPDDDIDTAATVRAPLNPDYSEAAAAPSTVVKAV